MCKLKPRRSIIFATTVLLLAGCSKAKDQPVTPQAPSLGLVNAYSVYAEYLKDERAADLKYKGKFMSFGWCDAIKPSESRIKEDAYGKYVPMNINLLILKLPEKWVEGFRCYVREGQWFELSGGEERCEMSGICKGMRNEIIIMEKCGAGCSGGF